MGGTNIIVAFGVILDSDQEVFDKADELHSMDGEPIKKLEGLGLVTSYECNQGSDYYLVEPSTYKEYSVGAGYGYETSLDVSIICSNLCMDTSKFVKALKTLGSSLKEPDWLLIPYIDC